MTCYSVWLIDSEPPTENGRAELKARLVHTLGLPSESIEKVFSNLPVALKKELNEKEAQQYLQVLQKLGAKTELRVEQDTGLSFDETTEAPQPTIAPVPPETSDSVSEEPLKEPQTEQTAAEDYSLEDLEAMLTDALDEDQAAPESQPEVTPPHPEPTSSDVGFSLQFDTTAEPEEEAPHETSRPENVASTEQTPEPQANLQTDSEDEALANELLFTENESQEDTVPPQTETDPSSKEEDTGPLPTEQQKEPQPPSSTLASKAFAKPAGASVGPQKAPSFAEAAEEEEPAQGPTNGVKALLSKHDSPFVRGGLILLVLGVLVLIFKPELLLGPSEEDSAAYRPSKEEVASFLNKHKRVMKKHKKGKAKPKIPEDIIRHWEGSSSQGPAHAQLKGTTKNGEFTELELVVKSDAPPKITPEEFVEGVSRPWLRTLVCSDFKEAKTEEQGQVLVGSAKTYISDGNLKTRAVAEVELSFEEPTSDSETLQATWTITDGDPSKAQGKLFHIEKVSKRRFNVFIQGEFTLQSKAKQEETSAADETEEKK